MWYSWSVLLWQLRKDLNFLVLKDSVPVAGGQGMASIDGQPLTGGPSFSPGASASSGEIGGVVMLTGEWYRKYVEGLRDFD
jgi:hypothetical protein